MREFIVRMMARFIEMLSQMGSPNSISESIENLLRNTVAVYPEVYNYLSAVASAWLTVAIS